MPKFKASERLEVPGRFNLDLPDLYRRRFDQFTIRVIRITDYKPAEPAELFYRLNQPASLTAAEQRNAFFGTARNQVRNLVGTMKDYGITKEIVGFSNSRMAYDDIVARVAMTLDNGTLSQKIDSGKLASQYRADQPFKKTSIDRITEALKIFSELNNSDHKPRFNKATLYSWLIFIIRAQEELEGGMGENLFKSFITDFESAKIGLTSFDWQYIQFNEIVNDLISVYEDRATSRVGDALSVIYRDMIIWTLYIISRIKPKNETKQGGRVEKLRNTVLNTRYPSGKGSVACQNWLLTIMQECDWGEI